jgi:hypothetical protein
LIGLPQQVQGEGGEAKSTPSCDWTAVNATLDAFAPYATAIAATITGSAAVTATTTSGRFQFDTSSGLPLLPPSLQLELRVARAQLGSAERVKELNQVLTDDTQKALTRSGRHLQPAPVRIQSQKRAFICLLRRLDSARDIVALF